MSRRPGAVLVVLTLLLSLLFTLGPAGAGMGVGGAVAVSLLSAASVWLSGHRPAAALVLVGTAVLAQPLLDVRFGAADLVVVLVAYRAAADSALRPAALVGLTFLALTAHDWWVRPVADRGADPSLLYPAILTALSVGLGLQGRRVVAQAVQLRRLRDAERDRAVMDERRRIARDLHDVAAHHLSSLVVHNRLAQRLGTPEALGTAVEFSAVTASSTLDSLRGVVGTLSDRGGPPRSPTPLLRDLPSVLDLVGSAGLDVHRAIDDEAALGSLDDELQVALVRVAQEALSNVLHHRGPGACWVELRRRGGTVELVVEDDGPTGLDGHGTPAVDPPGQPATTDDRGHGIVGMRERVRARGGRLTVGPSPRGGLRLQASFDVDQGST